MTDATRTRLLVGLLAVMLVVPAVTIGAAAAGNTTGATQTDEHVRNADLSIRQPGYISSDVTKSTANGTPLYSVAGEEIYIQPENFQRDNVVDWGVQEGPGNMTDEGEFGYRFTPGTNASGTYKVYWVVTRDREVTEQVSGPNNTTTNQTVTEEVTIRYEALFRVQGQTDMVHLTAAEDEQREKDAAFGRDVRDALDEIRALSLPFVDNSEDLSDRELFQNLVNRFINTGDPVAALTGGYTQIYILIFLGGLGGYLFAGQWLASAGAAIWKLKKRLNIYEIEEEEAGTIAEKQAEVERDKKYRVMHNIDWGDIYSNGRIADEFREAMYDTPWETAEPGLTATRDIWTEGRAQVLANEGYFVGVEFASGPDGEREIADIRVFDPEAWGEESRVDKSAPLSELLPSGIDIDDEGGERTADHEEWMDEITLQDLREAIWEADEDVRAVETDVSDLENPSEALVLPELLEELNLTAETFDTHEEAGEHLLEFLDFVEEHDFTDPEGIPDARRDFLNAYLHYTNQMADRHHVPGFTDMRRMVEYALQQDDPHQRALESAGVSVGD